MNHKYIVSKIGPNRASQNGRHLDRYFHYLGTLMASSPPESDSGSPKLPESVECPNACGEPNGHSMNLYELRRFDKFAS